jgi:hypothetical protein
MVDSTRLNLPGTPIMKRSHILATTAATVLGSVIAQSNPAQAAIITYDFNVTLNSGPLSGNNYTGFFTYDDSALAGNLDPGDPPIYIPASTVSFNFDGVNYNQNDFSPGFEPEIKFIPSFSSEPFNLSWDYVNPAPPADSVRGFQFLGFLNGPPGEFFYTYVPAVDQPGREDNEGYGSASFTFRSSQAIPEPATILGTTLFGLALGWKRTRSSKS